MFKYVHHVSYVVENLDAMVEYLKMNFDMKPDSIGVSKGNHPAKDAVYYAGVTEIQISEPTNTSSPLAIHLAKYGPGVFHVAWGVSDAQSAFDRAVANGNKMRSKEVNVSPRGYKTVNIDPSATSFGMGFQLIEDPCNKE
jgi:4-hydroxyphenylpyruvate dioxygenase-like putative hemolysin